MIGMNAMNRMTTITTLTRMITRSRIIGLLSEVKLSDAFISRESTGDSNDLN